MGTLRVLLVDDDVDMRKFIKNALQRGFQSCEVDEASDGIAAREHMEVLRYDLVLCDWSMPGLTGEDLLRWMKGEEKHKNVPFILITGHRDRERLLRALDLGVNDYILKPISIATLMEKINAANKSFVEKIS